MKKFLIMGNGNAVKYKDIFRLIKDNKIWLGAGKEMGGGAIMFQVSDDFYEEGKGSENKTEGGKNYIGVPMVTWFTNIDHEKRHTPVTLTKEYHPDLYPRYDNVAAIEVKNILSIPKDYYDIMGVPITFASRYNPDQFEILGCSGRFGIPKVMLNNKEKYARLLIRRKL